MKFPRSEDNLAGEVTGSLASAGTMAILPNIAQSNYHSMYIRGERRLWWGALVTSWFWLTGALGMSLLKKKEESTLLKKGRVLFRLASIDSAATNLDSSCRRLLDRQ